MKAQDFEHLDFGVFSLQPLDNAKGDTHLRAAFDYCLKHPKWRLSLQTHKILGVR